VRGDERADHGRRGQELWCHDVSVGYSGSTVLANLDMAVEAGEIVALLGASGSGKSTLLNVIAGIVQPSAGEIWLNGRRVADAAHNSPPERRDVGMVFQNFALWPHLCVLDTVAYPLRRAGRSARVAASSAMDILAVLEIGHLAKRRPAELSGGEQQRVGLARALARNARLYLLDEPTAHLDTHLRAAFQESILARQAVAGAAVVYATHDSAEALALAHRVALLVSGRLVQMATPAEVYSEPTSLAAAALTGPCSVLVARVRAADGGLLVELGEGAMTVAGGCAVRAGDRRRTLVVRPDWVQAGGPFAGRVDAVAFCGTHTDYHLACAEGSLLMSMPGPPRFAKGEALSWGLSRAWALDEDPPAALAGTSRARQPSAVIACG